MTRLPAAALALLAAAIASAGVHAPGWFARGSSLLLYDSSGAIAVELPLSSGGPNGRSVIGGAAPNGRFAWTLERGASRGLRFYGSDGKPLWSLAQAAAPDSGPAVAFSNDGETLLLALRSRRGWTAQVRGYLGNVLYSIGPVPQLESIALTGNGRYATARWRAPGRGATHTFVDLALKLRRDIPSDELTLGRASVDADGRVVSGGKVVFRFSGLPAEPDSGPKS